MIITTDRENIAEIGDKIYHKKRFRKVIGYAIGDDGRDCYVTATSTVFVDGRYEWCTFLVPIDEVKSKFVEVEL